MPNQKSPRVWFITGCSTGFGRELTEAALAHGDCVIATARKVASLKDFEQKYPNTVKIATLDVTDKSSIQSALKMGLAAFGRIDLLVNNAGYGLDGAIEEVSEQQMRDQFETNVFGVLNVIRAALPTLKKQKSGHILNFSSVGGRLALAGIGLYSASKYAVEGLSEALAIELKPLGIKVTIVEPGAFDTDFAYRSLVHANVMPEYEFLHENRKTYMANVVFGDPATGMQAVLKLVDMPEPPLHFTIGPNSMTRILQKLNTDIAEYESYKDIWEASTANSKKK